VKGSSPCLKTTAKRICSFEYHNSVFDVKVLNEDEVIYPENLYGDERAGKKIVGLVLQMR